MLFTRTFIVKGRVQGVNYRASAKQEAEALQVKGTAKNLANGNVEIIATATKEKLDAFEAWCWKGPAFSTVTQVEATETPLREFTDFRIIR